MLNGKANIILKILSWSVLVLSVICSFSVFTLSTHDILINSDAVSVQFIYNDLIAGNGKLKDWFFPTAPSVFPDLLLYSILQLFHFKFTVSILLYAIVQTVLICLLSIFIFKKIASDSIRNYTWLIPVVYSMFFMETFYFSKDILMNQLLTTCYYHTGAFVNTLIAFSVFLSSWPKIAKYAFILIFSAMATFSDMLYIVMFVVPFSVTLLFSIKRHTFLYLIICFLSVGLGCYLGMKLYNYVTESGITYFFRPHKMYEFSNILPALNKYIEQITTYILKPGFRSFHVLFTLISIPTSFFILVIKRKTLSSEIRFFIGFYFLFSILVISAPIINGNYTGFDTLRYSVAVFYLSVLVLALFISHLLENQLKAQNTKQFLSFFVPVVFLVLILIKLSPSGLKNYVDYYPQPARELDSLSEKHQLKHGIAWQTHSKYFTAFSKKNLEILTVHANGCIWEMASNISWYYDNDFDFIITHGLEPDLATKFGVIDTLYITEFTILKVKKFHYPKGTYVPLPK